MLFGGGLMLLGVDFGGTKLEAALIDGQGQIRARLRCDTPKSYDDALRALGDLIARVVDMCPPAQKIDRVGIGIPGSISPVSGLIRNANSTFLNGRDFVRDLEASLGLKVRVANDANCFALSEAIDGAGKDAKSMFGLILGTGCGGGVVINKALVTGAGWIAGELGHMPLPWPQPDEYPGPQCWCGRYGCLETFVSGPAVERHYHAMSGQALALAEIVALSLVGNILARQVIDQLVDRIARGLAVVVDILDPEMIVLGGGLSNIEGIAARIEHALPPYVFADHCATGIKVNQHGDSSGVRGAAWLWAE